MPQVIESWFSQVDDITIWDDSGENREYPNEVTVIRASRRMGSHVKFKSAQLLKNDMVLITDDDIIPEPRLVIELVEQWNNCLTNYEGDREDFVVSIFGRKFSKDGYQSCPLKRADLIFEPIEVDWAGRLLFGHRRNFMVDITACPDTRLDDLFWSFELHKQRPQTKIFIVQTKEWRNTPDSNNEFSLSRTPGYWKLRDDFVKNHYEANNGR